MNIYRIIIIIFFSSAKCISEKKNILIEKIEKLNSKKNKLKNDLYDKMITFKSKKQKFANSEFPYQGFLKEMNHFFINKINSKKQYLFEILRVKKNFKNKKTQKVKYMIAMIINVDTYPKFLYQIVGLGKNFLDELENSILAYYKILYELEKERQNLRIENLRDLTYN